VLWTWLSVVAGSIFWAALQNTTPTELFLVYIPLHLDVGIIIACAWERLISSERMEETKTQILTKSGDSKCDV
jgi:hypothetical protein